MAMTTLEEVQAVLSEDGFDEELVAEGSQLQVSRSGVEYDPHDLVVSRVVRFGRISTDEDEVVLFALSTNDGSPLGTYAPVAKPTLEEHDAQIVQALDSESVPEIDGEGHGGHDHIAAIFDDRAEAHAATVELTTMGISDDLLGLALREGDPRPSEIDAEADMIQGVGVGAAVGASVGFLSGMPLIALALVPGGVIGLGGMLALGGGASVVGAMLGGYMGIGANAQAYDESVEFDNIPLEPGQTLIAVCSHGDPVGVAEAMERHGGKLVRRVEEEGVVHESAQGVPGEEPKPV